jgi:HEAT repeat protein
VQLRERGVPGSIQRLLRMLDSPHEVEREAAHAGLGEFRFARYLALFDTLAADARRATGLLVKQIDGEAQAALRVELAAAARSRRKRALEMCLTMNLVAETIDDIANLLRDEDQFLRIEAIRVLATHDCETTRHALRDSLVDGHPLVQEAAEFALTQLLRREPALPNPQPEPGDAPVNPPDPAMLGELGFLATTPQSAGALA